MKVRPTEVPDVLVVELTSFGDPRGRFMECYQRERYAEAGIDVDFVQDNVSHSTRGVLRGLHFQNPRGQAKLITVLEGAVFDVAVDIRAGSPTFGQWAGVTLSEDNGYQLFVPAGFAHGFCALSERVLFHYKCSDYYSAATEHSIQWNDPAIGVAWPIDDPILSAKDVDGVALADMPAEILPPF